jgi:hypothetical protein
MLQIIPRKETVTKRCQIYCPFAELMASDDIAFLNFIYKIQ